MEIEMGNMQENILKRMSQSLLKRSSTFRDNLSTFLLNRQLHDLNYVDSRLFNSIRDEMFKNPEEGSNELINNLTRNLFEIFNQPDWLTLTRVLQAMKKLPTRYPMDSQRLSSMYLRELKFTRNYRIDLKEFSKAMCEKYDPEGIKIFRRLNKHQKNIIELLNQEQIEALANFRSESIGYLSKLMHISAQQRNAILSFTQAEIRMYKLMHFTPEKMLTLKNLLQYPGLPILTDEGKNFIRDNHLIEDEDVEKFKLKNNRQKHVIRDLDVATRNALVKFDNYGGSITLRRVLRQAIKLGAKKKDIIVLLTSEQLDSILDGVGAEDLLDMAHLTEEGRAHMMKVDEFNPVEEHELLNNINQDQRQVLSKLFVLCPDGLEIIKELGPERTHETITSIRDGGSRDFNIKQKILAKRIERLSVKEKGKILNLTLLELFTFGRIFQLGHHSIRRLMNLSKEGMIVLKSMESYNADQIQFVLDRSTQGISVLAENAQLNPTKIEFLREFNLRKSQFLINLNLQQRHYLSTHRIEECLAGELFTQQNIDTLRSLTSPQERWLLSTISALTEREVAQFLGIDENNKIYLDILDPPISRLFVTLKKREIHKLSKTFDWRANEKFAFGLWNPRGPTIKNFLHRMISPIAKHQYREEYLKFITGVVRAYQSACPRESTLVENMATAIDTIYGTSSKLEFYIYLLNYSIEDNVGFSELEYLFSKIPDTEFIREKLRELCDISNGEVPFLFRWMLVNPFGKHQDLSNRITRGILSADALNPNPKTLDAIIVNYRGIQSSDVIQSLRNQLKDGNFSLTHSFFFNQEKDFEKWESITKWLSKVLTPDQQFEFLNSPINHVDENSLDVLGYSLFYDRGCSYPLLERLNSDQLRQLFDKHPVRIVQAIVRNGHFRTLQIFSEHVGKERLLEVIRNNRHRIFLTNRDGFVFGNHRLEDLARTIRWFAVEDPDAAFYSLIETQLALEAKAGSRYKFSEIIEILAPDQLDRNVILREVRKRRPPPDFDGPSCPKSIAPACIDSTEEDDIDMDEKEHLIRALFGNIETEHNDLHQLMHLDPVVSEIRDVLRDIKDVAGYREKVAEMLSKSNVATRIQKVAERRGLAPTVSARGDLKSLNLWALPQLGFKVSEKLLAMGQRVIGPVLGRGIGNFGAFLGLVDYKDINIITNSVFIFADIPALVTDILAGLEIPSRTIREFAGPVGVIVLSESIQAALQLNNISKQIKLTLWEGIEIYLKFMWDRKFPDDIMRDSTTETIYNHYISKIIHKYHQDYGMIGISLPPILITEERYCKAQNFVKKRILPEPCIIKTTTTDIKFNFSLYSFTMDPFSTLHDGSTSRVLPASVSGFHLICGPKVRNAQSNQISFESILPEDIASDQSKGSGKDILMDRTIEKWYIPQQNNGVCDNILLYKNQTSKASQKMLFYLPQDASMKIHRAQSMDVIFSGKNIFLFDHGIDTILPNPPRSNYYLLRKMNDCTLYKEGLNFLVIKFKGTFACDLGGESRRQINVAVVQGRFTDIKNIHSIIGSQKSDRIDVSHSVHVDGKGGRDTINAHNSTTVKSYYGDVIHGKAMTLLPMNVSEIHRIVVNKFITVYNGNNRSVQVDVGSVLQTNDKFLIYPMKINNETHAVTHLYVHKNVDGDVVLEDELAVLELMKTTRFNCSKQITSRNYDITLSDNNHSIFHADRNHHNFYWEAADGKNHLYIFEFITANITISRAKGILDFSQFNHVFQDSQENLVIVESEQSINIGGLRVKLLNRQSIKVTFDGQNYYDIKNGRLERDYCPYSSKIDGRLIVDGQELFDHHNCFEFRSDKIIFYKQDRHLLLSSGRNMLSITNFYPLVHENLDVSLKLDSRVLGPDEFREKASSPDPFRFYEIIERGLTIYHNLPIDKDQIGVIYTNKSSISDHDIDFQGDDLLLTNRNGISVTLVDWKKYQVAREVMFAFNDTLILNAQCVSSTCTPEYIFEEFQRQKQLVKSSAIRHKRNVHLDSLHITGNSPHRLNNTFNAFKDNVNLILLFVQSFLDKKYPLPQFPSINREEVCAYATNITQSFQKKLKKTSQNFGIPLKDSDCFELYSDITEYLKNEEYSKATRILNSVVEGVFQHTA